MQAQSIPQAVRTKALETVLTPWPLPVEWIIQGKPAPSGAVLSKSNDSRIVRGIWACTPGQFKWSFTYDETVVVLKGSASVQLEHGNTIELKAGDMAFFERGQTSVWTIHEDFRKAFHADSPEPLPF